MTLDCIVQYSRGEQYARYTNFQLTLIFTISSAFLIPKRPSSHLYCCSFSQRFISDTRHKTYKGEKSKRNVIQQPPGKRRRTNQLTHLLTHQWISSPSSPSSPSQRHPHPSLLPPSMLTVAHPNIASSHKRPSIVLSDSALHDPHHWQVFLYLVFRTLTYRCAYFPAASLSLASITSSFSCFPIRFHGRIMIHLPYFI